MLRVRVIFIKIRQLRSHRPLHYHRHHHPFPLIPMNTLHQPLDFQPTSQINTIRQFQPLPLLPLLASALLQCLGPLVFAIVSTIVKVVSVYSYKCSRFSDNNYYTSVVACINITLHRIISYLEWIIFDATLWISLLQIWTEFEFSCCMGLLAIFYLLTISNEDNDW